MSPPTSSIHRITDSILRMATDIQFLQNIQNNITHNSLELTWNWPGIDLECAWKWPGICLEWTWNGPGIYLEWTWNIPGMDLEWPGMDLNGPGTYLEHTWNRAKKNIPFFTWIPLRMTWNDLEWPRIWVLIIIIILLGMRLEFTQIPTKFLPFYSDPSGFPPFHPVPPRMCGRG